MPGNLKPIEYGSLQEISLKDVFQAFDMFEYNFEVNHNKENIWQRNVDKNFTTNNSPLNSW